MPENSRKADVQRLTITRGTAKKWLSCISPVQRKQNPGRIKRYARVMNAGDWKPWTPVIAFDRKEELINGQHVLKAFQDSKLEKLSVTVSRNHDTDAYQGFDKNGTKSGRDDLRAEGVDRTGQVCPVTSVLWQYEQGLFDGQRYLAVRGGGEFPESSETVKMYKSHPGIQQHLHKSPRPNGRFSLGAMRAASWILCNYYPEQAPKFMQSFLQGINIPSSDHPIARLRKELLDIGKDQKAVNAGGTLARIFKAWNLYAAGKDVEGPHLLKKNEDFPDIHVRDKSVDPPPASARRISRASVM